MDLFKKKRYIKEDPEDDGRTIVNMNVDGMPWYVKGDEERKAGRDASHSEMSDEELKLYKLAALKSALLIVLVFAAAFAAFIAFCDFVWFR